MAYRFGPFLYEPLGRRLLRDGAEIRLTHKARELLVLFLENPGRLFTLPDLTDRVWPDVAVTDDAVRFQVSELRRALGKEGEEFIRTLPREGYRWEASVRREAPDRLEWGYRKASASAGEMRHRLLLESREVELSEGENFLGRDRDSVLWIDHTSVSRRHARILIADGTATLEDLGSKNGTHRKGDRISGVVTLVDGDEIRIGPVAMTFRAMTRDGTTETEERMGSPGERDG